ncbi:Xaa-Pro aminopeptidase 2 [Longimycelium tulufanense]|uniref:Xaa-Pro aminopeptidase n=1 Tax=Longimycelium tulufanense TaxID=907463 RepID=A0A8J3CL75_9PSEU|nr:aminopeptidase P family protein [Longimycelium tulufanense]GGM81503.1 Xaa-Pro aminopeptidase 2 [Longimycelium tulufanense]
MAGRRLPKVTEAKGFREYIKQGWGESDRRVDVPAGLAEAAAAHRARLSAAFPGRRIAVAAGRAPVRSNDTDYEFRADSDFVWLTGCQAEGAVLVMHPAGDGHEAVLYLRRPAGPAEPDFFANARDGELWIGAVPGLAEWSAVLGLRCREIDELPAALRGRLPAVLATRGVEPVLDAVVEGGSGQELRRVLAELRRIKDEWEIAQLRAAVDATVIGFAEVAAELPAAVRGGGERWLQGTFDRRARTSGNGPGYASIVAAGPNAPVLHWTRCDGPVPANGLLLIDAGVEMRTLYTADVTRTFPVSGEFSPAQRQVYDLVLASHLAAMAEVRPGNDFAAFHLTVFRVLAEGLHDWGLLPVSVDEALSEDGQQHRRYIVCGVGHFLGLDVHDCSAARDDKYRAGTLEPGMALTVEPGLYFHPHDLTVPPELRGIGVRIEDDLVVTEDGAEVLSDALPIEAEAVECWVREQQRG